MVGLTESGTNSIVVLPGAGDGTFGAPIMSSAPEYAENLLIADLNGDGKLDLLVPAAVLGSQFVGYVMLGNGDGNFTNAGNFTVNVGLGPMLAGDFNHDGKMDLAVLCQGNSTGCASVNILLGTGNGAFQNPISYPVDASPFSMITGDFNGDGILDLAVAGGSGIDILLGKGDGSFPTHALIPGSFGSVVAADFNGDGVLDLAVTAYPGSIMVFLGQGDGTFTSSARYSVSFTGTLFTGDFNGDGHLDLAVNDSYAKDGLEFNSILILPGNGDGTFRPPTAIDYLGRTNLFAVGDFNGDGMLDFGLMQYPLFAPVSLAAVDLQTTAQLSPDLSKFPTTLYSQTNTQTVTVTNIGASALNISQDTITGTHAQYFKIGSDTCAGSTIPPAGNCAVDVAFTPTTYGALGASLNIANSGVGGAQTAALLAFATPFKLTPTKLNFGSVKVGTTSPYQVIRVTNVTSGKVDLRGITLTGPAKGDYYEYNTCGKSLHAKATCSVVVQFIPTRKGTRNAFIGVDLGGQANPIHAEISGTGE